MIGFKENNSPFEGDKGEGQDKLIKKDTNFQF